MRSAGRHARLPSPPGASRTQAHTPQPLPAKSLAMPSLCRAQSAGPWRGASLASAQAACALPMGNGRTRGAGGVRTGAQHQDRQGLCGQLGRGAALGRPECKSPSGQGTAPTRRN